MFKVTTVTLDMQSVDNFEDSDWFEVWTEFVEKGTKGTAKILLANLSRRTCQVQMNVQFFLQQCPWFYLKGNKSAVVHLSGHFVV